jgi:glycosyltransferase involved in cell wall biosynthesis
MSFQNLNQKLKKMGKPYWLARDLYSRTVVAYKGMFDVKFKKKPRILFYNITGLGYSGTDKFLQVLAKNLNKERYDVYLMYGDQVMPGSGVRDVTSRLGYILDGGVFPIRFDYKRRQNSQPYFIEGMSPNIFDVIKDYQIDLVVTEGAGSPQYPFGSIRKVPIILINIFGEPNTQGNITYNICISHEVASHLKSLVPEKKVKVMYVPSEGPITGSKEYGMKLRHDLGIPDGDIVFGRIGRDNDNIFDPIGIRAFQRVVRKYPNIHYLIISPPPILEKIISEEKIPNIHHTPPSGDEKKMWGFYEAMDVLAHFRKDGESFGLNIAEAMFCGKPIISHKSHQWNAHLEYLEPTFSFIADNDNVEQYASFMEFFAEPKNRDQIKTMGEYAKKKAYQISHISNHIAEFENLVSRSLGSEKES